MDRGMYRFWKRVERGEPGESPQKRWGVRARHSGMADWLEWRHGVKVQHCMQGAVWSLVWLRNKTL